MTPEEWQRVRPILESALELDPDSRPAFLDGACTDSFLRREVESLISSHEQAGTDVLKPGLALKLDSEEEARFRLIPGKRIGVYEILEEIALGGMGAVYRAIRADGEYKQQVALKIVRADLGAELTAARFRHERQILASLDHPNIAKIFDGGTTADGLPYFVMELIDGLPITAYCDKHKLKIDERLRIFRTVCSAVHHAHQHLVVHRDIKPTNILITSDGVPKLLDFGIAKILDPALLPENVTMTAAGAWMMTPEYASPEQLRGEAITTATDVYSLGLVLYELLTGHRAYHFSSHMPHEIARAILETEPEKPSSAIRRKDEIAEQGQEEAPLTPELIGGFRSDSPEKLCKRMKGDLDNIVLKAIRKEPRERYSSVDQLSEDIRRHLEHLPVMARKGTITYRCRKYVLRHKLGVAAAALVFLSLLTGIALTMREARIARASQLRAERRFNDVRKLANSLLFDLHDAIQDLPGSTPARKMIVERALQYLDSLASDAKDAGLARELATAYERVGELQGQPLANNLGETSNSLVSYQKALKLRQQLGDRVNAEWQDRLNLAESYHQTATVLMSVANPRAALADIQNAVAITESMSNASPNDLNVLYELGSDYDVLGILEDKPENYKKALAVQARILAMEPNNLSARRAWALEAFRIGNVQSDLGHSAEALASFNDALKALLSISKAPRDQRRAAAVYNQLAMLYGRMGNAKLSLANHEKALDIYKRLVSEDPKNALFRQGLAITNVDVGESKSDLGRSADGLADINKGLTTMKAIVDADPTSDQRDILAQMHISVADVLMRVRRFPEAIREYRTAMKMREGMHIDATNAGVIVGIATCRVRIADAERAYGNMTAASADFHEALRLSEPHLNEKDIWPRRNAAKAYAGLGYIEASVASTGPEQDKQHHWEQAIQWYQRSLEVGKQLPSLGPYDLSNFNAAAVERHLRQAEAALGKLGSG